MSSFTIIGIFFLVKMSISVLGGMILIHMLTLLKIWLIYNWAKGLDYNCVSDQEDALRHLASQQSVVKHIPKI